MAMNISDFQRKIGGNWVDLEENPYFNADENIYWDQTDVTPTNCNWLFRKIGVETYQKLTAHWDGVNSKWYVNFPAGELSGTHYEFVGHFQDSNNNTKEKTYLVIIDKTNPAVTGNMLFCSCNGVWSDATSHAHTTDTQCYLQHQEVTHYSIDEVNSTWEYINLDGGLPDQYTTLPDFPGEPRYFDWWPHLNGRFRRFNFPAGSLEPGSYRIAGTLLDKAGNQISSPQQFTLSVT